MGVFSSGALAGLAKVGIVVVLAGGLTAGAVFAYQTTQGGEERNYLLAPDRAQLMICVDSALEASMDQEDVDRVRRALDTALGFFPDIPGDYLDRVQLARQDVPDEYATRSVEQDCPEPEALKDPPVEVHERHSLDTSKLLESRADASPYRVHVYLMTLADFTTFFPNELYATAREETACSVGACEGVTRGLYVTRSASDDVIEEGLLLALNLLAVRASEVEIDWAACESGGQPYPYEDCDELEGAARDICARQHIEGPPPRGLNCSYWENR